MGLFSRKVEDTDVTVISATVPAGNEKESVVQVIRSRLYGKGKGKEKDVSHPGEKSVSRKSSLRRLIGGNQQHAPHPPSPLSQSTPVLPGGKTRHERVKTAPADSRDKPLPPPIDTPPQKAATQRNTLRPTDTVTVNLAQRLNELAAANSDGLLSDDDYRLLRQDLFERFAGSGSTSVPSEAPVVPAGHVRRSRPGQSSSEHQRSSTSSRPNSNFQVDVSRHSSVRSSSRNSLTSGVSSLFRRSSSSKRHGSTSESRDVSEAASVFSDASRASNTLPRRLSRALSRKKSDSSMRTETSLQTDTLSLRSKRRSTDRGSLMDHGHRSGLSSGLTKSSSSMRRLAAANPPSSFPGKLSMEHSLASNSYMDEDKLISVADIRKEIASVEAECRRLMDAFNGLELTTLTKRQRHGGAPSFMVTASERGSDDGISTSGHSRIIYQRKDNGDALSIRSNTSFGTSLSMTKSVHSHTNRKTVTRSKTNTSLSSTAALHGAIISAAAVTASTSKSRSNSLVRQESSGSLTSSHSKAAQRVMPSSSSSVHGLGLNLAPPVPVLPIGSGSRNGSSTSINNLPATASKANPTRSNGYLPLRSDGSIAELTDTASMRSGAGAHTASNIGRRGRSGSGASKGLGKVGLGIIEGPEEIVSNAYGSEGLDDIKRRREEVSAKYEARLDYLRAKLKGAMLHEKLLKR